MSTATGDLPALADHVDPAVVVELTQAVWASFVDAEVELLERWDVPGADELPDPVVGRVDIVGALDAVVHVALAGEAARELAARMLGLGADEVAVDDVLDATGEITNMVGGNLKAVLADDHRLGLPAVTAPGLLPGTTSGEVVAALQWGEHAVLVTVSHAEPVHLPRPTEHKDSLS
ncbi:chemotaxis protein CheX [Aquipuribacter sp. SD81]|uniref:chemotaxis protein CheX n=1 Tax=Aquipuribacter sp. SD81 TaxID=3127703 RepID=UPI0030189112